MDLFRDHVIFYVFLVIRLRILIGDFYPGLYNLFDDLSYKEFSPYLFLPALLTAVS
jgi:hypothetical protein